MHAWAISVVRYSAEILEWTDKELKAMDVKTRKKLTMFDKLSIIQGRSIHFTVFFK